MDALGATLPISLNVTPDQIDATIVEYIVPGQSITIQIPKQAKLVTIIPSMPAAPMLASIDNMGAATEYRFQLQIPDISTYLENVIVEFGSVILSSTRMTIEFRATQSKSWSASVIFIL